MGVDPKYSYFTLTHKNMTRFVMTLEQSVDLIEYALKHGESGDTVIPKLISMKVLDLIEIFAEHYGKPVKEIGLKPGEKMLESLINETQSAKLNINEGYYHIKYTQQVKEEFLGDYNSNINTLTKNELKLFLTKLSLI
jgi:FlaA1/EpsC-like NDP-sugar epimerase